MAQHMLEAANYNPETLAPYLQDATGLNLQALFKARQTNINGALKVIRSLKKLIKSFSALCRRNGVDIQRMADIFGRENSDAVPVKESFTGLSAAYQKVGVRLDNKYIEGKNYAQQLKAMQKNLNDSLKEVTSKVNELEKKRNKAAFAMDSANNPAPSQGFDPVNPVPTFALDVSFVIQKRQILADASRMHMNVETYARGAQNFLLEVQQGLMPTGLAGLGQVNEVQAMQSVMACGDLFSNGHLQQEPLFQDEDITQHPQSTPCMNGAISYVTVKNQPQSPNEFVSQSVGGEVQGGPLYNPGSGSGSGLKKNGFGLSKVTVGDYGGPRSRTPPPEVAARKNKVKNGGPVLVAGGRAVIVQ